MSAVLALCDKWEALAKGVTPKTRQIREAYAADLAAGVVAVPAATPPATVCGISSVIPGSGYLGPCLRPHGHAGPHVDFANTRWEATR